MGGLIEMYVTCRTGLFFCFQTLFFTLPSSSYSSKTNEEKKEIDSVFQKLNNVVNMDKKCDLQM